MITPILIQLQKANRVLQEHDPAISMAGVTVAMPRPLNFRAQIPWKLVPATLAGMKILATGATEYLGTVVGVLRLTESQLCAVERALGRVNIIDVGSTSIIEHDSDLLDEVQQLLQWGAGLAKHCPLESAAKDLAVIDRLDDAQLGRVMLSGLR